MLRPGVTSVLARQRSVGGVGRRADPRRDRDELLRAAQWVHSGDACSRSYSYVAASGQAYRVTIRIDPAANGLFQVSLRLERG